MEISIYPRIAMAIEQSSFLSSMIYFSLYICVAARGRSHLLIRKKLKEEEKNRRNNRNREEDKEDSDIDEVSILKREVAKLNKKPEEKEEGEETQNKYTDLPNDLFYKGIIDESGKFLA